MQDGDEIIDLPYPSWQAAFSSWEAVRPDLDRALELRHDVRPLSSVRLLPPLRPGTLYCAAENYNDPENAETRRLDRSNAHPYFFTKVSSTVIGPDDTILLPRTGVRLEANATLCAVIGRTCIHAKADDALSFVVGFTILNDLSARDLLVRRDRPMLGLDWLSARSFDTSASLGPSITLAEDVREPQALLIKTWLNHSLQQNSTSAEMIFTIRELIISLSSQLTLQPGDLIATGTPVRIGADAPLERGDVVTIDIEGLGTLRNPVL